MEDFLSFSEHYHFVPVFCNVEAGHEKNNVENSLINYNKELLKLCDQDAHRPHYRKEATVYGEIII